MKISFIVQKKRRRKGKKMLTVALIGGDGAGKTTIAKRLEKTCPLPTKYLYMGINPQAGKFTLPTSRLIFLIKRSSYKKEVSKSNQARSESIPGNYLEYSKTKRGPIWTTLRLINRLIEASYRQVIALYYQIRGYIVIYDRHPLFDTAPLSDKSSKKKSSRLTEMNHWIIRNLFPKPKLTIFLDAPAELLHERKRESTPEYLDRQRTTYLKQGEKTANFIRIDATQPLEKVYDDVQQQILSFHRHHRGESGINTF
jgi:thymidylate kinase